LILYVVAEKNIILLLGITLYDPPPEIKGMEMNVIPPGTHVDVYNAYNIMEDIKGKADILIPVHEPEFASVDTIG